MCALGEYAQDLDPDRIPCDEGSEQAEIVPFLDTELRTFRSRYLGFLRDLAQRALIGVALSISSTFLTPFFVRKKTNKQRLVWDCRNANVRFRALPMELGGAESLQDLLLPQALICGWRKETSKIVSICEIFQVGFANTSGSASTTPQMTCFRGAKVCRKWLQGKVTIKLYSLTTS